MQNSVEKSPSAYTGGHSPNGLIPLEQAAAELGITPQRLLGFVARNSLADPIGDGEMVYAWSLDTLRQRLADTSSVAPHEG